MNWIQRPHVIKPHLLVKILRADWKCIDENFLSRLCIFGIVLLINGSLMTTEAIGPQTI